MKVTENYANCYCIKHVREILSKKLMIFATNFFFLTLVIHAKIRTLQQKRYESAFNCFNYIIY